MYSFGVLVSLDCPFGNLIVNMLDNNNPFYLCPHPFILPFPYNVLNKVFFIWVHILSGGLQQLVEYQVEENRTKSIINILPTNDNKG